LRWKKDRVKKTSKGGSKGQTTTAAAARDSKEETWKTERWTRALRAPLLRPQTGSDGYSQASSARRSTGAEERVTGRVSSSEEILICQARAGVVKKKPSGEKERGTKGAKPGRKELIFMSRKRGEKSSGMKA